uniref:Uncharacterized protein n=1 Tax=Ditylenchus dipsaci TaxID=166011 RepID=A0A915EGD5_9BILA
MLSRLSQIKEAVTLSPDKIDKQCVGEVALLLKEFESNFSIDSVERRLVLTIIEKTLQSCWDSGNFRSIPSSNEMDIISQIILNSVGSMHFSSDGFWFERLGNSGVEAILQKLSESLGADNSVDIVNALMENDERCMYTLLALLEIQKLGIFVANSLDPASMFLLLIRNIHFDTQVVVDWLQSETVAIPFLLRFFKAISQLSKEAMLEKLSAVQSSVRTDPDVTSGTLSSNKVSDEGAKSSHLSFNVEELHGEQTVVRHVQLPIRKESYYAKQNPTIKCQVQEDQESFEESFTDFVVRLRLQLDKLSELLPFNVKPITKVLSSVEEILEE